MRHVRSLVVLSMTGVLLAGCATPTAATPGAGAPSLPSPVASASPTPTATVDPEAAAKADSWLEGAVLPAGAVRSESVPSASPPFSQSYYAWPCSPMETRLGYWTVEGAGFVDTVNWLKEHPTADLIVAVPTLLGDDPQIDSASVGNVPEPNALEGISYTVSRSPEGVAIRAEIGAFTRTTVCPTPPGGGVWGGPGQG